MVEPQIRYVRTLDGVNIAYFTMGNGVPLVFMDLPSSNLRHELASPINRSIYDEVARGATLVRYDHRGFGVSDKYTVGYTTDALVRDLEAVVDKLELRRFFLLALGITYPIALEYCRLHPERVLRFAAVVGGPPTEFTSAMLEVPGADWRFVTEAVARRLAGWDYQAEASQLADRIRNSTDPGGLRRINDWFVATGAQRDLETIAVPTLFFPWAAGDEDGTDQARGLASRMPNAAVQPIPMESWDIGAVRLRDAVSTFFAAGFDSPTPSRTSLSSASGTAVILFTDIVDSTALTERMGDTRFREASRSLDAGLRAAIRDAGGVTVEAKTLGDGVLATFSSAAQAIDGARRCLALSAASELGLHIGLHAGDVIREEGNVFGGAVNIASRSCGLSAAGEILVSDVVRGMARSSAGVVFEDRGEQEMKGVGEAVRVYAVRGSV